MGEDNQTQTNVPSDKEYSRTIGKTMGDVLDDVLVEPKKGLTFVALMAIACGLAIVVMFVVTRLFHLQTSEIQLGGKDSHVILQRVQGATGSGEYVMIVNPQGWQSSGIPVIKGDRITITAGGKIAVDMGEILEKVKLRKDYEDALADGPPFIKRNDPKETRVPEDFFTDKQKESLILHRPWIDPDGFSLDVFQPDFRSRRDRYLLPGENAGGLVAAIKDGSDEPGKTDAFFVGREKEMVAPKDGVLWFTVNDVQYNDPKNKNLFYNDNIGTFWAQITVKRG